MNKEPSQIAVDAAMRITNSITADPDIVTLYINTIAFDIQQVIDKATEELRKAGNVLDELLKLSKERGDKAEAACAEMMEKAAKLQISDPENQVPVCLCCCMELDSDGKGHRNNCIANLALSTTCGSDYIHKSKMEELIEDVKPLLSMLEEYKFTYHRRYSDFITKYADKLK